MTKFRVLSDSATRDAIVSEDRLGPLLRQHTRAEYSAEWPNSEEVTADQIASIRERWVASIERHAANLRKHAAGTLEQLPTGCLYEHLDNAEWKRAALVCEVLRHPTVSKNSGWLDTRVLQARIAKSICSTTAVKFIIGWGQPKRDAAGLKTAGPFADLSEVYAIGRLGAIVRAISLVLGYPVTLTVLSGGARFRPALFTESDLCATYDKQRQRIADGICGVGTIIFTDYVDQLEPKILLERQVRYRHALESVSDEAIASQVDTVLVNIDWHRLFEIDSFGAKSPYGLPLPIGVRRWSENRSNAERVLLMRAALCSIVTPRAQAEWQETLGDTEDLIQDTAAFMRAVAWDSTRKYIALHAVDAVLDRMTDPNEPGQPIRLTVHQKRDRPDIPAIFTLGPSGGNALSQHVVTRIEDRGLARFESLADIRIRQSRPVMVRTADTPDKDVLFDWLDESEQPLCFVDPAERSTVELIGAVLDR